MDYYDYATPETMIQVQPQTRGEYAPSGAMYGGDPEGLDPGKWGYALWGPTGVNPEDPWQTFYRTQEQGPFPGQTTDDLIQFTQGGSGINDFFGSNEMAFISPFTAAGARAANAANEGDWYGVAHNALSFSPQIDTSISEAGQWANEESGGQSGRVVSAIAPIVGGIAGTVYGGPGLGTMIGAAAGNMFAGRWNNLPEEDIQHRTFIAGAVAYAGSQAGAIGGEYGGQAGNIAAKGVVSIAAQTAQGVPLEDAVTNYAQSVGRNLFISYAVDGAAYIEDADTGEKIAIVNMNDNTMVDPSGNLISDSQGNPISSEYGDGEPTMGGGNMDEDYFGEAPEGSMYDTGVPVDAGGYYPPDVPSTGYEPIGEEEVAPGYYMNEGQAQEFLASQGWDWKTIGSTALTALKLLAVSSPLIAAALKSTGSKSVGATSSGSTTTMPFVDQTDLKSMWTKYLDEMWGRTGGKSLQTRTAEDVAAQQAAAGTYGNQLGSLLNASQTGTGLFKPINLSTSTGGVTSPLMSFAPASNVKQAGNEATLGAANYALATQPTNLPNAAQNTYETELANRMKFFGGGTSTSSNAANAQVPSSDWLSNILKGLSIVPSWYSAIYGTGTTPKG